MKNQILSKSLFLTGNQCAKALYLQKYHPELKESLSEFQESIFRKGREVNDLALGLFPGGIKIINSKGIYSAITQTNDLISKNFPAIYEASFIFENSFCALDILIFDKGGWNAYEVKSSTEVDEINILDAAYQYCVITNSGLPLKTFSIVHLNKEYVRGDELDVRQLFKVQNVLSEVKNLQPYIKENIEKLQSVLKQKEIPKIDIGIYCSDPYPCSFHDHCWKHIPKTKTVFNISGLWKKKKFELYKNGIVHLKDVPSDYKLSKTQKIQVKADVTGQDHLNMPAIKKFLSSIKNPLCFLDFESIQLPVPIFQKCKPYQQIVFQFSLFIQTSPGAELIHSEFLGDGKIDPRLPLIQKLLADTASKGDIIVYNAAFEKARLKELAYDFPQFSSQIKERISRIKDLLVPFKEKAYYKPDMNGSASIKSVLPALVPGFDYNSLEVGNGMEAMTAYETMYYEKDPVIIKKIRENLLKYCRQDTLAMVKILEVLERLY